MADAGDRTLLELWRAGDETAAAQIFERYVERLVALARKRLSQRLARRVDPEDVVQSVFRTFFDRARKGEFSVRSSDDLAKLLFRITVHKTLRKVEYHTAAKRDVNAEAVLDASSANEIGPLDVEPSPEAVSDFVERLERFMTRLRADERQVLELRLEGYTNEQIATRLGTYERKIYRLMEHIRTVAEQEDLSP